MNRKDLQMNLNEALMAFLGSIPEKCEPYGNGHINDTYLVSAD